MNAFINSVPKSGTNMLHKALELIGFNYNQLGIADTLIHGRHHWIRLLIRNNLLDKPKIGVGLYRKTEVGQIWLRQRLRRMGIDNFVTGHSAYDIRLRSLLDAEMIVPIIVLRDPRDVLLSHVNYFPNRPDIFYGKLLSGNNADDLVTVLRGVLPTEGNVRSFREAYLQFLPWIACYPKNIFRFEHLVGPRGGGELALQISEIARLSALVGKPLEQRQTETIAAALFGGTPTFSKGQCAGWKSSKAFLRIEGKFNASMEDVMDKLGYDLE